MEIALWILGIIIFLIGLAIFIGLHEAGHAIVAKLFKLDVPKFFIGFGPTLWSKKNKKDTTEYGVKAIPLGGFVIIEDSTQEKDSYERMALSKVNPFKRILVYLAGPLVNILLGILILMSVLLIYPYKEGTNEIKNVNTCAVALKEKGSCTGKEGGLLKGDFVTKIGTTKIETFADFDKAIAASKKKAVDVEVIRDGATIVLPNIATKNGKFGINLKLVDKHNTLGEAWGGVSNVIVMNAQSVVKIYEKVPPLVEHVFGGGEKSAETPSSVIVVGKTYGDTTSNPEISTPSKVQILLTYSGLFNLGIGFLNLLPIMPLDGGRILIATLDIIKGAYAKVRRKQYNPVSKKTVAYMTAVTMTALFAFFLLVMASDVLGIAQGTV